MAATEGLELLADCPFIVSLENDRVGPSPWLSLGIITDLEKRCPPSLT